VLLFFDNWPKFFSLAFQTQNNLQFCEICGYLKRSDNKYFFNPSLLLLSLYPGSGIGKNQDPGWVKLRIWDPG